MSGRNAYFDPATGRLIDPDAGPAEHVPQPLGDDGFGSSLGSSPVRPQVSSSVRPTPSKGDEHDDLVPEFVPSSSLEPHSWAAHSLIAEGVRTSELPAVAGLFYLGRNHLVSGESESGKSWLALAVAAAELGDGHGVVWIDGDDVGAGDLLERLRALGVGDEAIDQLFAYVRPDEPLDAAKSRELVTEAEGRLAAWSPWMASTRC